MVFPDYHHSPLHEREEALASTVQASSFKRKKTIMRGVVLSSASPSLDGFLGLI